MSEKNKNKPENNEIRPISNNHYTFHTGLVSSHVLCSWALYNAYPPYRTVLCQYR